MELYAFLLLVILAVCDSIKFNPELQRNILKFGYDINYKYEVMLAHSFNRLYIVIIHVAFGEGYKILQPKF